LKWNGFQKLCGSQRYRYRMREVFPATPLDAQTNICPKKYDAGYLGLKRED